MSDEIDGTYRILSFIEGNPPIGVNLTLPSGQRVYVNAPVDKWMITKVNEDTYTLGVGGYGYVGVADGKVFASTFAEQASKWNIVCREPQDAYTITLADRPGYGWTIPVDAGENAELVIGPIVSTRSLPPRFMAKQLFLLEESDD